MPSNNSAPPATPARSEIYLRQEPAPTCCLRRLTPRRRRSRCRLRRLGRRRTPRAGRPRRIAEETPLPARLAFQFGDPGARLLQRLLLHQGGLHEEVRRGGLACDVARDQALGLGVARLVFILLQTAEQIGDQIAFLLLHDGASLP